MDTGRVTSRQRGFTLVELLVAIALQGLLLITLSQLYVSNKTLSNYQAEVSMIHEAAGYVTDLITTDVRMAGFAGCRSLDELSPNVIADNFNGFSVFGDSVEIFENGVGWTAPAGFTREVNTDVLSARYVGQGAYLVGNMTSENANVQVDRNPGGLEAGDLVLITDCNDSDIFRATSVSNSTSPVTIAHAQSNNSSNRLSKAYGEGTQIFAMHDVEYFVGTDGTTRGLYAWEAGGTPVLLTDSIADMELSVVTRDGVATGVRYGLLLNSRDHITSSPQTFSFDGVTVNNATQPGADRRLRREFWGFINLRNSSP